MNIKNYGNEFTLTTDDISDVVIFIILSLVPNISFASPTWNLQLYKCLICFIWSPLRPITQPAANKGIIIRKVYSENVLGSEILFSGLLGSCCAF